MKKSINKSDKFINLIAAGVSPEEILPFRWMASKKHKCVSSLELINNIKVKHTFFASDNSHTYTSALCFCWLLKAKNIMLKISISFLESKYEEKVVLEGKKVY